MSSTLNDLLDEWSPEMSDHPEHPLAAKLYRDFRAGSKIMTKDEAWRIANELDAQLAEIVTLRAAGAKLVKQALTAIGVEALEP